MRVKYLLFIAILLCLSCGRTHLKFDDGSVKECQTDSDCDDGNLCNGIERCVNGVCMQGVAVNCDDGIDCTRDECNPSTGTCSNIPDHSLCPEGELCIVEAGGCVPVSCTDDSDCDDGIFCNGEEYCLSGNCYPGIEINCNDNIPCTMDSCNEEEDRCEHIPMDSLCDDGLICNGQERCDPQRGCVSGEPLNCDDGDPCTIDRCEEGIGCVNEPIDNDGDGYSPKECGGEDCDDTDPLINPDAIEICNDNIDNDCDELVDCLDPDCQDQIECQGCNLDPSICDDGIYCTQDICNPETGQCINIPDHSLCREGMLCIPERGGCVAVECRTDAECDDGIYCNGQERCVNLVCTQGEPVNCDDGIDCTLDLCDEDNRRCIHQPLDQLCDDGLICNGQERCDENIGCIPGIPLNCDDSDPCTDDRCEEPIGCVHTIRDRDGDGEGDALCGGTDCNDLDPEINSSAQEICDDGMDNDCDNLVDCDDSDCEGNPVCCGPEICNGLDDDCNGFIDDGITCVVIEYNNVTYYLDPVHTYECGYEFYQYDYPDDASANPDPDIRLSGKAVVFVYTGDDCPGEYYVGVILDDVHDGSGGNVNMNISIDPPAGSLVVSDDWSECDYNSNTGRGGCYWRWWPCCTDGVLLGPFYSDECFGFYFFSISGIDEIVIMDGTVPGINISIPGDSYDLFFCVSAG